MELEEAQNGNHTSHGPQVHSARVGITSRLPKLAATKARCISMDPGPSVHYRLQTHHRLSL